MNEVIKSQILNIIDEKLEEMTDFAFSQSQINLDEMKITDTGWLKASGNIERGFLNYTINYSAPYAIDIEYGTPAHPVNPAHLVNWARRKLRARKPETTAYFVAKKISEKGTFPRPFLRSALEITYQHYKVN